MLNYQMMTFENDNMRTFGFNFPYMTIGFFANLNKRTTFNSRKRIWKRPL